MSETWGWGGGGLFLGGLLLEFYGIHFYSFYFNNMKNVNVFLGYPTFPPPGGPQHPPYQLGGFPPQACAPSANELRLRQESAIRQGIAATVVTQTYRRRSCTYRLARLGIGFLLIGVTILITLGILIVRPAMNDLQLQRAQCKVISSEYTQEEVSCSCGRYCSSHYPCLQIQVAYISAKGKWQTAYLYQDVYDDKNKVRINIIYRQLSANGHSCKRTAFLMDAFSNPHFTVPVRLCICTFP